MMNDAMEPITKEWFYDEFKHLIKDLKYERKGIEIRTDRLGATHCLCVDYRDRVVFYTQIVERLETVTTRGQLRSLVSALLPIEQQPVGGI